MFVSIKLSAIVNPMFELSIDNRYDDSAEIQTEQIGLGPHENIKTEGKILFMPGIVVFDHKLTSNINQELSICLTGEHFFFNLISNGGVQQSREREYSPSITRGLFQDFASTRKVGLMVRPGNYCRRIFLVITLDYITELLKDEPWDVKAFLSNREFSYQNDISIRSILDELNGNLNNGIYRRSFFELKLKEFFLNLHQHSQVIFPGHDIAIEDKYKLIAARDYLASDFVRPPTIPELSRIILLNEFKLKQYFKRVFGKTIHHYIIELRMQNAEQMLLDASSVAEVSERVGYRSVSHFILAFKKYFGKTPKQMIIKRQPI